MEMPAHANVKTRATRVRLFFTIALPIILAGAILAVVLTVRSKDPSLSPAGVYLCNSTEAGLTWGKSFVVTLNPNGTIAYPYGGADNAAWTYSPSDHQVSFTNFVYATGSYSAPDFLEASHFSSGAGIQVGIECHRQKPGN